jgi:hypothetical protein
VTLARAGGSAAVLECLLCALLSESLCCGVVLPSLRLTDRLSSLQDSRDSRLDSPGQVTKVLSSSKMVGPG